MESWTTKSPDSNLLRSKPQAHPRRTKACKYCLLTLQQQTGIELWALQTDEAGNPLAPEIEFETCPRHQDLEEDEKGLTDLLPALQPTVQLPRVDNVDRAHGVEVAPAKRTGLLCHACGDLMPLSARYCGRCGRPLREETIVPALAEETAAPIREDKPAPLEPAPITPEPVILAPLVALPVRLPHADLRAIRRSPLFEKERKETNWLMNQASPALRK